MMDMGESGPSNNEFHMLQKHVDDRFQSIEGWLKKVSTAIDRLVESNERLQLHDHRLAEQAAQIAENSRRVMDNNEAITRLREQQIKMLTWFSIIGTLLTLVVPSIVSALALNLLP